MNLQWKTMIKAAITIFCLFLAIEYWPSVASLLQSIISAAYPVVLGLMMAYILNILMRFYEKHYFPKANSVFVKKSKRPICLVISILTLILIIVFVISMVVPELASCIQTLMKGIPPLMAKLTDSQFLEEHLPSQVYSWLVSLDWNKIVEKAYLGMKSRVGGAASALIVVLSSAFSKAIMFFLAFIFTIYFLLGKEKLTSQAKRLMGAYLSEKSKGRLLHVFSVMNSSFSKFIVGQCTESVILGALCMFGMWVFRFPYAVMVGTLIGFTALIPVAGAYIGAGAGAIMIATISFPKALLFIVFIVILQQLEGNLIYPRVVGNSINLPAVWVLAAITVGGGIMGIGGMLLGVPLAASIYTLIKENVERREKEKSEKTSDKSFL